MSKRDIENRKPIRELIQTDNSPNAVGTYSQAVSAGGFLYTSGQVGIDPATGEMVSNDVKNHFNDKVFKTIIPRNVRVSEAPSYGQPVLMYDISCPGSQAYASLAGEIINQEKDLKWNKRKMSDP